VERRREPESGACDVPDGFATSHGHTVLLEDRGMMKTLRMNLDRGMSAIIARNFRRCRPRSELSWSS